MRSCLEYASSSWWPWISATAKTRLERVQNAGLRAVAGLAQGCPLDFLRLETNVEPLSNRMDKNDDIVLDKYLRLPEDDPRRQLAEKQAPVRLKTRLGWRHNAKSTEICREIKGNEGICPWTVTNNICTEKVKLEKKKAEYTEEQLRAIATAKIESVVVNYRIFTDGSTDGNQGQGYT